MKTQDTYQSIIKGVSQQAPNERLEGQHAEQVNLLSDPVDGLVRRNGMVLVHQQAAAITTLDPSDAIADSYGFRVYPFSLGRNYYDLLYRSRPRVGAATDAHLPAVQAFAKQGTVGFLPTVTAVGDTALDAYLTGGLSSVVVLGRLLLMAGNTVQPVLTSTDRWGAFANQDKAVVYIASGAYKRTYTIKAKNRSTGTTADVSYTTPSSAYPGTLVVDDLDPSDPDYQYYLNNRIYAFENAQNAWTVSAAEAIVPSAIAEQLRLLLVAAGMTGWTREDNYLYNADIEYATASDDTGNTQIRVTHNDAESEQKLSPRHYNGKVVKVTPPNGGDNSYYLEAETDGGLTFGEVTWRETAGVQVSITSMLAFGTIENETLYLSSSPSGLAALVLAEEGITIGVPVYAASQAGDLDSPGFALPAFASRPIDLLAIFQDRLIVGTGNILRVSAQGDYLNFFRTSALTVPKTDATEMFANGTAGDTIHKAALYDRNMVFYGDSYHYVLVGRTPFDPENPAFSVQYSIEGTGRSQPVLAGDKVVVLKEDAELAACQVLQLSAGVWQDSPQVDTISKPLRSYLNGTPAEMVALTSPSIIFVRTEFINRSDGAYPMARPFGLYTYNFMDDGPNRVHESWSSWEWSVALGTPIGISATRSGSSIYVYTLAINTDAEGRKRAILVQEASARTQPTGMPYLDGLQPAGAVAGVLTQDADYRVQQAVRSVRDASFSVVAPVADDTTRWNIRPAPSYSGGDAPPQDGPDPLRWDGVHGWGADWIAAHPGLTLDGVWTGLHYGAYVDLTSPVMRNHEDKARLYGYLTLTKLKISTRMTGGIAGYVAGPFGVQRSLNYDSGYIRLKQDHSMFVGRKSEEVQLRISSVEWHPMTISSIAWQGDWKNNQSAGRRAR